MAYLAEPRSEPRWLLACRDFPLRRGVDATVDRALKRGAKLVVPVETQFWGDRIGWVQDPAGHMWTIATRVEETTEEQRSERWSKILPEKS